MINILFVCTGNTCRSPMAEALLRDRNIPGVQIKSAGTYASQGTGASTNTKKVLDENGILHNHKSSFLTEDIVEWADIILTMTYGHKTTVISIFPRAQSKTYTLKEFANIDGATDIADPFGGGVEVYRETYEEINEAMDLIAERLKDYILKE
jgi:protein arginine phosphatase